MPGTNLGTAFVQVVPSAQGIGGALQNIMNGEAAAAGDSAGKTIASKIKNAIVAAGIGTAITAGIRSSLLEGAELEQNIGGTKAVFGDFYTDIQSKAKEAYMNMGLSASDYMATANKMGSLFQGSGIEQQRSLELTSAAMQRAADVASVMGIDTQWAMDSIANAAKGNFTMMDNLGVKMDATAISAYALEKGVNFDWNTASNAEKAELAMQMFMDRTSQYEGNFAKESEETFSGSLGAMKAAAQDFAANLSLGEDIRPALQNLISTSSTFLFNNFLPAIGNIFTALPTAIGTFIQTGLPQFMAAGTQLVTTLANGARTALPGMIQTLMTGLVSLSGDLRSSFSNFVNVGLDLVKSIADGIIRNIPTFIQTVPTIITNLAGLINDNAPKLIATGLAIIKSLAAGLIQAIPVLIQSIPQLFQAFIAVWQAVNWLNLGKIAISGIKKGLEAAGPAIKEGMGKVKDFMLAPIKNASSAIGGVVSKIKAKFDFSSIVGKVKATFNSIKEKITSPITKARDTVQKIVKKIKGFFPFNIGKIINLKTPSISLSTGSKTVLGKTITYPKGFHVSWHAKAMENPYMFSNPTLFGAGEAGDEVLYGRRALMRDISEAVGTKGSTFNVTLNATSDESPEEYAQRFARELRRQVRMGAV